MALGIDESVTPGTVHLVDLEGTMRAKHSKGQADVVLVPTPSEDPDDPLNWSKSRKLLSIVCLAVFIWSSGFCGFTANASLTLVSKGMGLSLASLNSGAGYLFLLAGLGNLFWQPMALQYGKRPVYILSTVANLAITAWTPSIRTTGQLWANKLLTGFFAAPIETLCEISIADVNFAHERSTYMAVYAVSIVGSNFFAPVIGGFISDRLGWEWCYYIPSIISAAGAVFLFFFMEETNYERRNVISGVSANANANANGAVAVAVESPNDSENHAFEPSQLEVAELPTPPARKTYLQKLSLWAGPAKPGRLWHMCEQPVYFMSWPVIIWAGFSYGQNLIWFNVLNGTASLVLSSQPYNFSASVVGLSFVAALLGAVMAAFYIDPMCDWLAIRLARCNGGVFEPEHRLWLFCINLLLVPGSLILWGVGAAHGIHWFGLVFAMFLTAIPVVVGSSLSVTYVVDSYQALTADAIVPCIIVRNVMSFAIGYGITPWIENLGYQDCFVSTAMVGLACGSTFLVMIKYGKHLRERSAAKYWQIVRKRGELGVAH